MNLTEAEIEAVLNAAPAGKRVEMIRIVDQVKLGIAAARQELREENKRHEDFVKSINLKIRQFQEACPHVIETLHSDPSGNNDSTLICETCEKSYSKSRRL